jgi:hypothetical protein
MDSPRSSTQKISNDPSRKFSDFKPRLSHTQKASVLIKKLSSSARVKKNFALFILFRRTIFFCKQPTIINCLFYSPRKLRRLLMILGNKLPVEAFYCRLLFSQQNVYHFMSIITPCFRQELASAGFCCGN